jgi:transcriptional regulator with XRE-family HTH domain
MGSSYKPSVTWVQVLQAALGANNSIRSAQMPERSRKILADNLRKIWQARPELGGQRRFAESHNLSEGTVSRARRGDVAVTLDTLDDIANALELHPWQLLIQGIDPANPPVLREPTEREAELYRQIEASIAALKAAQQNK